MDRSGEWLAPVSYLPGAQPSPADASVARSESAAETQRERARNVSLNSLARRGMSKREMERALRAKELDEGVIVEQIEMLERSGLVDDLALAQNLVASLQERKGLGRSGVAAELARRLLSPAAIEYALDLVDSGDELARARELAIGRARQLVSYDRETAVRRLTGYLARRGYSGSTIRAAVDHALPKDGSGSRPRIGNGSGVRFR